MAQGKINRKLSTLFGDQQHLSFYYYNTNVAKTIDEIIALFPIAGSDCSFGIDISLGIKNLGVGNRSYAFGWINASSMYGWVFIFSFNACYIGMKSNASTFTMKLLT